ncbi:MAG: citrate/2-methylcitrate synthase, partial [Cutibacterium granulosum]|nr:citrate/2-methylcitrate synthase [Cutibacterium granulosum]
STFSGSTAEKDLDSLNKATLSLLAKVPTLAAFAYKNSMGQPTLYPDNSLGYVENFIRMSFGFPTEPYEFNEAITRGLEVLLILHADHEQNCSTSTVRMVASSGANLHAAVAAGVNALSGPKHGGANQAVVEMLQFIRDNDLTTKQFVEKVKNREDGVKLMGFGHRIYRNYDPRAAIIKKHADEILKLQTGRKDLLEIAKELEETALNDDYFKERKLYPNVDFYSGLIYEAMGFPLNMFTVLFAIGRLPGWIAQYREQVIGSEKIWRPRQIYTGCDVRDWIPFEQRS